MVVVLLFLSIIFSIIVLVNFLYLLLSSRIIAHPTLFRITELWSIVIAPIAFLSLADINHVNNCCGESAVFSPSDRFGIYLLIFLCICAYLYTAFRRTLAPPFIEVIVNVFLLIGLVLNVLIGIHLYADEFGGLLAFFGNMPIVLLFTMALIATCRKLTEAIKPDGSNSNGVLSQICVRLLHSQVWQKVPVLALLALPILLALSLLLFLFGQKPDAFVRAFTDTYKHGFSQLDYMCDNVQCGGHFLCSVAAGGHKNLVKPQRFGVRNGGKIVCNRQLLIANAFEDLVQEYLPALHRQIRNKYNIVGNLIHRYYFIFESKWVADVVYIAMKPVEWLFLLTLYSFDRRPETRIAKQYLSDRDRQELQVLERHTTSACQNTG